MAIYEFFVPLFQDKSSYNEEENEFDSHENEPVGRTHFRRMVSHEDRRVLTRTQKATCKWPISLKLHLLLISIKLFFDEATNSPTICIRNVWTQVKENLHVDTND